MELIRCFSILIIVFLLVKPTCMEAQVDNSILASEETDFPHWFGEEDLKTLCFLTPNITVAQDGTGQFQTIGEAIAFVPENGVSKFVIHIKEGVYREKVIVPKNKINIIMFGDGGLKTIVSGNLSRIDQPKLSTFQTATFSASGKGFVARDMSFVNTAGPTKNQVVAFHSRSNQSVLYRCIFEGFQDTLYAHVGEQFYRECTIIGTVDFIFGYASAVFQKCSIQPQNPLPNQVITVTAQGAFDPNAKSAFSIVSSTILPYPGQTLTAKVYLGRPWKPFATVIVMKTMLGEFVEPQGWLAWNNESPPSTLTYGEYKNYGPGSDVSNRVKWTGYTPRMTDQEAEKYTVNALINQEGWLNGTCVPYEGSL